MDSYKSLVAWKRASELCVATLEAVDESWHPRGAAVFEQPRRAVISADINIVEGYALNTAPLFRRHLRIAIGSAAEAERLLQIAAQRGYMSADAIEPLNRMVDATIRALFGLLRSPKLRRRSRL